MYAYIKGIRGYSKLAVNFKYYGRSTNSSFKTAYLLITSPWSWVGTYLGNVEVNGLGCGTPSGESTRRRLVFGRVLAIASGSMPPYFRFASRILKRVLLFTIYPLQSCILKNGVNLNLIQLAALDVLPPMFDAIRYTVETHLLSFHIYILQGGGGGNGKRNEKQQKLNEGMFAPPPF